MLESQRKEYIEIIKLQEKSIFNNQNKIDKVMTRTAAL